MKINVAKSNQVASLNLASENRLIGKKMSHEWLLINRQTGESHVLPALRK